MSAWEEGGGRNEEGEGAPAKAKGGAAELAAPWPPVKLRPTVDPSLQSIQIRQVNLRQQVLSLFGICENDKTFLFSVYVKMTN